MATSGARNTIEPAIDVRGVARAPKEIRTDLGEEK
jgi:hypothetical protein